VCFLMHGRCWVLSLLVLSCLVPSMAGAKVRLLENRLELTGYVKEYLLIRSHIPSQEKPFHRSNASLIQSSALVEVLYRLDRAGGPDICFFTGLRYWYQKETAWDSELKKAVPRKTREDFVHTRNDEFLTEAYLDISGNNWQVLAGKQIVVWGETDIVRTADVVNPLDLRYSLPGIDFWEELKQGLWMIRGLWQSGLPGSLLFEAIFIPGDFRATHLPGEGTHWGPNPADTSLTPGDLPGYSHWLLEKMRRDEPKWRLRKNYEWGVRLRGYTWDIDWTLLYFNTLSDTATADPARVNRFTMSYIGAALRSLVSAKDVFLDFSGPDVFRYKRYQVIGGTAQTCIDRLHGSVWRVEWFYEIGRHYNLGEGGQWGGRVFDEVRKDAWGVGINYCDKFRIPGLTHRLFTDKQLEVSLTFFYEKISGYSSELILDPSRGHRIGSSHAAMITWSLVQPISHQTWTFIFSGLYNPNGMYFLFPMLSFAPGNHWRCEIGAYAFGYRSKRAKHPYHDKDSFLLRLRYEW